MTFVRIRKIFIAAVVGLAALAVLTFMGDYAIFRLRAARGKGVYGAVTVDPYYAVAQKNGKTQFIFQPTEVQTCIHALFPHAGYKPCWYLSKHTEQRTDI